MKLILKGLLADVNLRIALIKEACWNSWKYGDERRS
jgi:hypothetical protein